MTPIPHQHDLELQIEIDPTNNASAELSSSEALHSKGNETSSSLS